MPDSYSHQDDGRFHTRYSELAGCSNDRQAIKLAKIRAGLLKGAHNAAMDFGRDRHQQFDEESKATGFTPEVFQRELGFSIKLDNVERHRASELFAGVVLHFQPDGDNATDIVDYKTTNSDGRIYPQTQQLPTYALALLPHGSRIQRVHYLVEQWDRERTKIMGYHHFQQDVTLKLLGYAKKWLKGRVELLMAADDFVKKDLQDNGASDMMLVY